MNIKMLTPILFALVSVQAYAVEGKVTITSPANGATVSSKSPFPFVYDAVLGPDGDHLHLYVDGNRVDVLHLLKGTTQLDALPAGKHHICMTENTKAHAPIGVESCVDVTSQ